jgi:copper chaperone CopZ
VSGQVSTPDGVHCNSEANAVINQFTALTGSQQQDIINFLRSL